MTALKRLDREITQLFPNTMNKLFLPYKLLRIESPNSEYVAEVEIIHDKKLVLHFTIPSDYPFKPPTIWVPNIIANKKYDRWSADLTNIINKMPSYNRFLAWAFSIIKVPEFAEGWNSVPFKFPITCLCCNSITCPNNWGPSHTISKIFIEYLARKNFAVYCSSLGQKRISSIFNNDRWNLSDDIIFCILQHLNIPNHLKIY